MKSKGVKVALFLMAFLAVFRLGSGIPAHGAEPCGSENCIVCHEEQGNAISMSVHRGGTDSEGNVISCESCHGPSAEHCEAPEENMPAVAFADSERPEDKLNRCLGCHAVRESSFHFRESAHIKGGVTCDKCHQPHYAAMNDKLLPKETSSICLGCHEERLAEANLNERHRVLEGMVSCVDCHDQHGPSSRNQLGGFKQEVCYKCHTDKQGPFLYEHLSVRIERCSTCHDPHGSVNRHMLRYQQVADLCFSCHVEPPSFHRRFTHDTQCTNCHASIHGSNLHPAFLD